MRKLLFLFCSVPFFFFGSCSVDDGETQNIIYPLAPVESAELPDTLFSGEEYTINVNYILPSSCHEFNGILAQNLNDSIYIGVQTRLDLDKQNCEEIGVPRETSFNFIAPFQGEFFTFKFWQGETEDAEAIYLNIKVPVKSSKTEI